MFTTNNNPFTASHHGGGGTFTPPPPPVVGDQLLDFTETDNSQYVALLADD